MADKALVQVDPTETRWFADCLYCSSACHVLIVAVAFCRLIDSNAKTYCNQRLEGAHDMWQQASREEKKTGGRRSHGCPTVVPASPESYARAPSLIWHFATATCAVPVKRTAINHDIHSCTVQSTLLLPRDARSSIIQRAQHASNHRRRSPLTARRQRVRHQHTASLVPAHRHGLCNHRRGVPLLEPPATDRP